MPKRRCASVLCLVLQTVAAASGCAPQTTPRAPAKDLSAPARVLAVRTERFSLRASAYVELYAELARRDAETPKATRSVIDSLVACDSDACARARLGSDAHGFEEALPPFLRDRWRDQAFGARASIERSLPWLFDHEDALVARLSRELGMTWPDEPIMLPVTNRAAARHAWGAIDAPTLDIEEGCFEGPAILECAFTRSVLALASRSELLRAAADPTLTHWIVMHAVGSAVQARVPTYVPQAARAQVVRESPHAREVLAWLGREWPKRARGEEESRAFATRAREQFNVGRALRRVGD